MQPDLENMNDHDLCDLLVVKTTEFLKIHDRKNADGYKIRDLKLEIEKIQETIKSNKSKRASVSNTTLHSNKNR
jgi:hypothetical protein